MLEVSSMSEEVSGTCSTRKYLSGCVLRVDWELDCFLTKNHLRSGREKYVPEFNITSGVLIVTKLRNWQ